jgi:hypothetical protein
MDTQTPPPRQAGPVGNALVLIVVAGFLALAILATAWDVMHL